MLSGQRWLLLGGTGLILAALAVLLVVRRMPLPERLVWTLVLGGGLGNFIDRARTGVVVDYLNFQFISFPVFNFADICVCVGVGLLILLLVADMVRGQPGQPQGRRAAGLRDGGPYPDRRPRSGPASGWTGGLPQPAMIFHAAHCSH